MGVGRLLFFGAILRVQNRAKFGPVRDVRHLQFVKVKASAFAEPDQKYSLPILRHKTLGINHLGADVVTQFALQGISDDAKRVSLVMAYKILHILQQKCRWPVMLENSGNIKKQCALRLASEAMGLP